MPNRLFDIELWKADRSAKISLPESLYNSLSAPPSFNEKLGGIDTCRLTLYSGCKIAVATDSDAYRLSQGKLLRFIYDDGSIKEYRINQGSREFSGKSKPTVTAEPIGQDLQSVTVRKTLDNGHTRATIAFFQQSFSDIAGKLLSEDYNCPAYFELGNVPSSFDNNTYNLNLNAAYLISGLKELCLSASGEWDISYNSGTDTYQVNFYESGELGGGRLEAANRTLGIKPGEGNRLTLERRDETDRYFSRVIGLMGQENETQTMAAAKWDVASKTYNNPNSTITLSDSAIAKDGYGLISGETVYFGNETEGWHELQDTNYPDSLTVIGDASGISHGYFKIGANKDDVVFLEDGEALENIGIKEEKFARTDIVPYANLVEDAGISAALSDWIGGLPEGFIGISGDETITQESNDLFVKHGVLSARIEANTGEGLKTIPIDINPEELSPYFSLQTYLQVQNGSVRIEIEDSEGNIYPTDERAETNSKQTIGLAIGGEEIPAGSATIRFIANEDNTVFYVDALAFTQSGSPQPYSPLMGPRALWMEAGRYLKRYGGDKPDVWSGEGMDNAFFGGGHEIEIGSWITVQEDYNEDTGQFDTEKVLRVIELRYDEDRIKGRYRKTVRLASERSDASRFFQEQFVTKDDLQAGVSVEQVPSKSLYDRIKDDQLVHNSEAIVLSVGEINQGITEAGDPYTTEDGDDLVFVEGDEDAYKQFTSAELALLRGQAVLKTTGKGGLALVRLDSTAEDGSTIKLRSQNLDIRSIKAAIVADESITLVADTVRINNIRFDKNSGAIRTVNFKEGKRGWIIDGEGDAEFNSVVLRNGLFEDSRIRNLKITGKLSNEDDDFRLSEKGYKIKAGEGEVNRIDWASDLDNINATIIGQMYAYKDVDGVHRIVMRAQEGGDGTLALITAAETRVSGRLKVSDGIISEPQQRSGTQIAFDVPAFYNATGSLGTGNITHDLTEAAVGIEVSVYHSDSTSPSVPADWVHMGGSYVDNEVNLIQARYINSGRIEYVISQ